MLQDPNSCTVPLGLYMMKGLMSMGLVSILPMLVILALFQRSFAQGIARSGM